MNRKQHVQILLISALLALLAGVWVCLFPLVSIATGEWKCRGGFVSENALSLSTIHSSSELLGDKAFEISNSWIKQTNMSWSAFVTEYSGRNPLSFGGATAVVIDALGGGNEYMILTAPTPTGFHVLNAKVPTGALLLALAQYLRNVPWLSKHVVVIWYDAATQRQGDEAQYFSHEPNLSFIVDQLFAPTDLSPQTAKGEQPHTAAALRDIQFKLGVPRVGIALDFDFIQPRQKIAVLPQGPRGILADYDLVFSLLQSTQAAGTQRQIEGDRFEAWLQTPLLGVCEALATILPAGVQGAHGTQRGGAEGTCPPRAEGYIRQLTGMARFAAGVAFGPVGAHGSMAKHYIHSVSLAAMHEGGRGTAESDAPSSASVQQLHLAVEGVADVLERVVRAVSNLDEDLHASFYYYLIPSWGTFVSIGEYGYSLGLLHAFIILVGFTSTFTVPQLVFGMAILAVTVLCSALTLLLSMVWLAPWTDTVGAYLATLLPEYSDHRADMIASHDAVTLVLQLIVCVLVLEAVEQLAGRGLRGAIGRGWKVMQQHGLDEWRVVQRAVLDSADPSAVTANGEAPDTQKSQQPATAEQSDTKAVNADAEMCWAVEVQRAGSMDGVTQLFGIATLLFHGSLLFQNYPLALLSCLITLPLLWGLYISMHSTSGRAGRLTFLGVSRVLRLCTTAPLLVCALSLCVDTVNAGLGAYQGIIDDIAVLGKAGLSPYCEFRQAMVFWTLLLVQPLRLLLAAASYKDSQDTAYRPPF